MWGLTGLCVEVWFLFFEAADDIDKGDDNEEQEPILVEMYLRATVRKKPMISNMGKRFD